MSSEGSKVHSGELSEISFGLEDRWYHELLEDLLMVIMARIGTGLVKRILMDIGADSNIMFRNVFDDLGLKENDLKDHRHGAVVMRLGDNYIKHLSPSRSAWFWESRKSTMAEFVVLRDSTAYNIILVRRTINELSAIICTKLLTMKFLPDNEFVGLILGDVEIAIACDYANLTLRKKSKEAVVVFLADLDAMIDEKPRNPLMEAIRANGDLFAWTLADILGIGPDFMSHRLAMKPKSQSVAQRRRKMSSERADEVFRQTTSLLKANFIRKLDYSTWLSNVVPVKKTNEKWRMCVDYSNLNKTCPKDSFPLPNIDTLVDTVTRYIFLNFMDAYLGYNQIPIHRPDEDKTTFITPAGTYCYKVMLFGLKNEGATYQRLMNKVFKDHISKLVEVIRGGHTGKDSRTE
ncbi:uncharacterized protein LOC130966892 [Arachis stenosperma]|uniref:uncharacterized protein LOC130966892 n=1 Tax=Arachis stenosperma TaxID=217475 RepID=UPI0025AD55D8|nr:uncharacterized protein LOC130966892 [Arachis stenosperma]